ncbi:hypothetical protein [Corynebacterium sp. 11254D000AR]
MQSKLNPAGWVRLVIYVIAALLGVAGVVTSALDMGQVSALLATLASAGAAITGGTAVANLPKAHDQKAGFDVAALLPAIRDISDAARTYQDAVAYEGRHAAENPGTTASSGLPVYTGPTSQDS